MIVTFTIWYVNWILELVKHFTWLLKPDTVVPQVEILARNKWVKAGAANKKKCATKQLSQEMKQNDFAFSCARPMSWRWKFTPSVKQMIALVQPHEHKVTSAQSKQSPSAPTWVDSSCGRMWMKTVCAGARCEAGLSVCVRLKFSRLQEWK